MDWLWQHLVAHPERWAITIAILACYWQEVAIIALPIGVITWIIW